ncbi:MAG TPA: ribonuclease H-like domain-containing protein [Candidatus Paceibacterota bacterium]|nr:ribonuclease H-like domain-containing protein [Candidatus Paceibacterota bacterium]
MALVFDIETVGEEWNALDETTQHNLSWYVRESSQTDEQYEFEMKEIKEGMGLSPLTGFIVAIGVYDTEKEKGAVYFSAPGTPIEESEEEGITYKAMSEKEMLVQFWKVAAVVNEFISFNGRGFDAPFLALRSMVHQVVPTKDLLSNRYLSLQRGCVHVDLMDQLTFYGAARFRKSLHLFSRALGIKSPKAGGTTGDDVAALYAGKEYLTIARYNAGDLFATAALYKRWKETFR